MSIFEVVLLAIGLAMDCLAVAIAGSIEQSRYDWPKILRMALLFGLFQGVMPLISWLISLGFTQQIKRIDHWLALTILAYIGGKMIVESLRHHNEISKYSPYGSLCMLLLLAVATSIDALATGLIFVPLDNLIFAAITVIAVVSFLFTLIGCILGIRLGKRTHIKVELIGGLILIGIGLKICIEHLVQGC